MVIGKLVGVLIVSSCVTAGAFSAAVHAQIPGSNGRIIFTSNDGNDSDIYEINPDGTDQRIVFNDQYDQYQPSISPNGEKIVYRSTTAGNSRAQIFIADRDGSNQSRLLAGVAGFDFEPSFSPDGHSVLFSSFRDGDREIYLTNLDTGFTAQLTNNADGDSSPTFVPDGKQIVFVSDRDAGATNNGPDLYVMRADGSDVRRLTDNAETEFEPSVSPDGSRILFYSDENSPSELYTMSINGGAMTRLTNNAESEYSPSFSPDGTQVLYDGTGGAAAPGQLMLHVIDLATMSNRIVGVPAMPDGFNVDGSWASVSRPPVCNPVVVFVDAQRIVRDRMNCADPDGDSFTLWQASNPQHGAAFTQQNGDFAYAPAAGFAGNDAFGISATDSRGAVSAPTQVSVRVRTRIQPRPAVNAAVSEFGTPSQRAKVRSGRFSIKISCSAGSAICADHLRARAVPRHARRARTVATAAYSLQPGQSGSARFKLNKLGAKLLRDRNGNLAVAVSSSSNTVVKRLRLRA